MDSWQATFSKRVARLHQTAAGQFDRLVNQKLLPVYSQYETFLTSGGLLARISQNSGEVRAFHFAVSESLGVDLFFTLRAPGLVEASRRLTGNNAAEQIVQETVSLLLLSEEWVRRQFQTAIDALMSAAEIVMGIEGTNPSPTAMMDAA